MAVPPFIRSDSTFVFSVSKEKEKGNNYDSQLKVCRMYGMLSM